VSTWYWELSEMLRKFLLVGLLIFISPGEPAQVACALFITLFFLFVHTSLRPFATRDLNHMQAVSQGSLMLTLIVGLMMIIGGYKRKEQEAAAAGRWALEIPDPLFETNQFIFELISVTVNLTTTVRLYASDSYSPNLKPYSATQVMNSSSPKPLLKQMIPPLILLKNLRSTLPDKNTLTKMNDAVGAKFGTAKEFVARRLLMRKANDFEAQDETNASESEVDVHLDVEAVTKADVTKVRKLQRPCRVLESSTLLLLSESRRSANSSDKSTTGTADAPYHSGKKLMSDDLFRLQLIEGTQSPMLTSEEELGHNNHSFSFISNIERNLTTEAQRRMRKLALTSGNCSLKSDSVLVLGMTSDEIHAERSPLVTQGETEFTSPSNSPAKLGNDNKTGNHIQASVLKQYQGATVVPKVSSCYRAVLVLARF